LVSSMTTFNTLQMQSPTSLNMLETLGLSAQATLNEMEELFPPLSVGPTDHINTIMFRAGQRSVVEWLKQKLEQ
jgi:hypothetical protein